jgi:hypothetical protein
VHRLSFCLLVLAIATTSAAPASAATGGQKISVRAAPWAVHIQDAIGPDESYDCSGSIIDESHVLTAAHCLFDLSGVFTKPERLTVVAGVSDFRHPRATDARQERRVRSMRVYPGYFSRDPQQWSDIVHDLAVLELARPLDLSGPTAGAVVLASAGDAPATGSQVAFAGFGRIYPSGGDGPLVRLLGHILARSDCTIVDGILCASSVHGRDCSGDSGSGLVTVDGEPRLVAVLSSGAADQACNEWAWYTDVETAAAQAFIFGHTGAGIPPPPPATRWVPSGWKNHTLPPIHKDVATLVFSLPRTWSSKSAPFVAWSSETGAEVRLGSRRGVTTDFFADVLAERRSYYRKLDPAAVINSRELNLPAGRALEVYARVKVPKRSGGGSVTLAVRTYVFLHGGVGVIFQCTSPVANDRVNLPLFDMLARTIHFRD